MRTVSFQLPPKTWISLIWEIGTVLAVELTLPVMFEPDVVTLIVLPWLFGATSLRMPALNVTLVTPARSWRASSGSIGRCQDAGAASGALAGLRVETNFENERVATE